ncbi:hypothetical protein BH09PLA1_BH09PLA1_00570 [soil metagenome]
MQVSASRSTEDLFELNLKHACRMDFVMFTPETLESRRLLSVSVNFDPSSGQLEVFGVGKDNNIRVTMVNTEGTPVVSRLAKAAELSTSKVDLQITKPGPLLPGVNIYDGTSLVFSSSLKDAKVQNVDIYGSDGRDAITVYSWNSRVTSRVFGQSGDDTIHATANNASLAQVFGGDGNDYLNLVFADSALFQSPDAGAGNDIVNVFGSPTYDTVGAGLNCTVLGRFIYGGDGNDVITTSMEFGQPGGFGYIVMAGAGNDVIEGSSQADQLYGEDGNDTIDAGAGDDYLNGGLGDDWLCGEDGNDFLDHGGGTDTVDGGNGFDTGIADKGDTLIDMEQLI